MSDTQTKHLEAFNRAVAAGDVEAAWDALDKFEGKTKAVSIPRRAHEDEVKQVDGKDE